MEVSTTPSRPASAPHDEAIEGGDGEQGDAGVIARRLHDFFSETGLPRHKHASQLAVILGLSRSGAFRKFQDGAFSAADLQALAQHFQVDVSALLRAPSASAQPRIEGEVQDAQVFIGTTMLQCRATLGAVLQPGQHCELVATRQGAGWMVQPYAAADSQAPRRRVLQLVLQPTQRELPRLAVLEDSRDLAANLKDVFEASGFRVEVFSSAKELAQRATAAPFDAYLVDWWLNGQTAGPALQIIRQAQPAVPLILTTGAIATGHVVEEDIVRLATALRIQVVEKPFRLALIVSQVRQLVEQAAAKEA